MARRPREDDQPEFSSIEAFVQLKMDDGTETFTHLDLRELSYRLRRADIRNIRLELEGYGLRLVQRPHERRIRGFTTSSNDRWYGPGSCPTHGGSGFDNRE